MEPTPSEVLRSWDLPWGQSPSPASELPSTPHHGPKETQLLTPDFSKETSNLCTKGMCVLWGVYKRLHNNQTVRMTGQTPRRVGATWDLSSVSSLKEKKEKKKKTHPELHLFSRARCPQRPEGPLQATLNPGGDIKNHSCDARQHMCPGVGLA